MCGRLNIMDMPAIEAFLQDLGIGTSMLAHDVSRYNVAPGAFIPAVGITPNIAQMALWGREMTIQGKTHLVINTRAEKVATSWSWKEAFNTRPAVIFCNGFYEWQRNPATKQAYFIHDDKPMALAALWFDDAEPSVSIITEAAHASFSTIHHRQPVALKKSEIQDWLEQKDARRAILNSPERPEWQSASVSNFVNNARNEGAQCISPIPKMTSDAQQHNPENEEDDNPQLSLPDI